MVPFNVEVTHTGGEPHTYEVTARVLVDWESHHSDLTWRAWVREQQWTPLCYLGWLAEKESGAVVKPFTGWLDNINQVRLVPKEPSAEVE